MEQNKQIKKAMTKLEQLSEDEELRRVAELEEKALRDEKNKLRHALKDGFEQGLEQSKKEIAKKLLTLGFSEKEIIEITCLQPQDLINL